MAASGSTWPSGSRAGTSPSGRSRGSSAHGRLVERLNRALLDESLCVQGRMFHLIMELEPAPCSDSPQNARARPVAV
jgi:hypothetical protein